MQYLYLFLLGGKLKIHFALSQAKYSPQCQWIVGYEGPKVLQNITRPN